MAKKKEQSASPKLGAQYQAAKLGLQVIGPPVYTAVTDKKAERALDVLKHGPYQKSVLVALADAWGSKKLGHAGAISRNSLTAIAPEVLAGVEAAHEANLDPVGTAAGALARMDGYDVRSNTFEVGRVKTYAITKYSLGIGRKIVNKTRIAEPVKQFLSMLGVTL